MPDNENYLKGVRDGADVNVPQALLDGNYVSYSRGPASPTDSGVEGQLKTAPDGLYYYSDGLWRKVPSYTVQEQWDDLTTSVRFLQLDRDMALTAAERARVRDIVGITVATPSVPGLVKPSGSTQSSGGVNVDSDGGMFVPYGTETAAGVLRITEDSTGQPVAASKGYVDALIGDGGSLAIAPATATKIGGIRVGGDIEAVTVDGYASVAKASQLSSDATYTATPFGLARLAPSSLSADGSDTSYDDAAVQEAGMPPYVATVSAARGVARYEAGLAAAGKIGRDAYATTSVAGTVRIGSGIIVSGGVISVPAVSEPTGGTGLVTVTPSIVDGGDIPTPSQKVPNVAAVRSYVAGRGFISVADKDSGAADFVASSDNFGFIKVNANSSSEAGATGLVMSQDGTLSLVFPYASADKAGIVKKDSTMAGTEGVPETRVVKAYVDSAVSSIDVPGFATGEEPGTVTVQKGSGDDNTAPYKVPTLSYVQADLLASTQFNSAVDARIYAAGSGWTGGVVTGTAEFERAVKFDDGVEFQNIVTFDDTATFNETPKIANEAAAVKPAYGAADILSYTQVMGLVNGAAGVPWATYSGTTVTVNADMVLASTYGLSAREIAFVNSGAIVCSMVATSSGLNVTPSTGGSLIVSGTLEATGPSSIIKTPFLQAGNSVDDEDAEGSAIVAGGDSYLDGNLTVTGISSARQFSVGQDIVFTQYTSTPGATTGLAAYSNKLYWRGAQVVTGQVTTDPKAQKYRAWTLIGVENAASQESSLFEIVYRMDQSFGVLSYVNNGEYVEGPLDPPVDVKSGIVLYLRDAVSYADIENSSHDVIGAAKANKCAMVPAFIPDSWV